MTNALNEKLRQAAQAGDLAALNAALAQGAEVDSRGGFGDTALNEAAHAGHLEAVRRLLSAGADVENHGGADLTPLMNAAFAGHFGVVQFLLEQGALVSNDLLTSLQVRVKILEENARSGQVRPEAVAAWQRFQGFMVAARLRQDLPQIVAELDSVDAGELRATLSRLQLAGQRGVDLSAAVPRLQAFAVDPDPNVRLLATSALTAHAARQSDWSRLRALFATGDNEVRTGLVSSLVGAARNGWDISPMTSTLGELLAASSADLRHDAAIALGFAAANGHAVAGAAPHLARTLSDSDPEVRKMSAWALYRFARYLGDISPAQVALQAARADPDPVVRATATEALQAAGQE